MLTTENNKKILILLQSTDIENVNSGIELVNSLWDDIEDVYRMLQVHQDMVGETSEPSQNQIMNNPMLWNTFYLCSGLFSSEDTPQKNRFNYFCTTELVYQKICRIG